MVREGEVVAGQLVERAVEASPRHDGRGLLFERSRGGVARIGEELFAVGLSFGVQTVERGVGHEDLAPDLEVVGPVVALQPQRHAAHGAHVGRHIVAREAVAARHGAQQAPVLVGERDGRTVELQFADVIRFAGLALDAGDEVVELLQGVGIPERKHRIAVPHGFELRREVAAHAPRGRCVVVPFGMVSLQRLKFVHQRVEFLIADFGCILDVIIIIVTVELATQPVDAFFVSHKRGFTGAKITISSKIA